MPLLLTKLFTLFTENFAFRILLCVWISMFIQETKIKWRKHQNQPKFQCSKRPTASSRQSAANQNRKFGVICKCIVGKITDFPDLNRKASVELFRSKLTSRACEPRAGLIRSLANRDEGLFSFNFICCSFIRHPLVIVLSGRVKSRMLVCKRSYSRLTASLRSFNPYSRASKAVMNVLINFIIVSSSIP